MDTDAAADRRDGTASSAQGDARHGALAAILAAAFGGAPLRLTPRPALEQESNHRDDRWADGRHLIVMAYRKPDEGPVAPVRECEALRLLAPLDIAPRQSRRSIARLAASTALASSGSDAAADAKACQARASLP